VAQLQHAFRLRIITNQVEHNMKTRLTKARKVIGKKSSLYDPLRVALVVLLQVLATRFGRDDADCIRSMVN